MATSEPDIKTKIAELRHEILSYKPGKAVPCDDELVVFPDQLFIGLIYRLHFRSYNIVSALRRALHGDVEAIKYADRRETSTEGQEEYLTDYISVIERIYDYSALAIFAGDLDEGVKDLAAKVACFVVLSTPEDSHYSRKAARKIKEITGRYPIVGLCFFSKDQVKRERERMREEGIVEVYEISGSTTSLSDKGQLQLLNLLHGCLREGDEMLANKDLKELSMNPRYSLLYERAKKEITGNQEMIEEIRQHERVEESLQQEMKSLQMKLEESSASRESIVDENARLKNEIVREKEKREQAELAIAENDMMAKNSQEMYKKREAKLEKELKAKERHMKAQKENVKELEERRKSLVNENEKLKNEIMRDKKKIEQAELAMSEKDKMAKNSQEMYKQREAELEEELKTKEQHMEAQKAKYKEREEMARCEVGRIKKEKEEERGRAAQLKEEAESNQRRVNSLAKLVEEKEHDKATLKQQVNRLETEIEERTRREKENLSLESALKNELKSEKERVEQLERETWKLRTKIQLESEIRSAEQKKKAETRAETPRWNFIPWIVSEKQTRTVQSPFEDPSREGLEESDAIQTGEEPPNDEFADILKQIADDLSDDAKIDSLGGQLGILQGDIDRALKTNMRYEQITSRGTYLMLKKWRRGVSREDERIALRRALEAAKLLKIADHYLPQEGSTASDHSEKAEDPHRLSREYGTASKQGSSMESPKHSVDDKQYASEDIMTSGGESEDAAEVTGTDQTKLEDPHGQSGKDGPPLGQGSRREQTEVEETTATIERSSPGDTSYMNEEENDGVNQQSEESSNHSTTDLQDISEDMPSGEMSSEKTSTSNENQIEYITTMFDDVVSSLVFSDAYQEKLCVLLLAKVIIDIH